MKKLVCDLCGSTDFVRVETGVRCCGCGCMYTLEQAKGLMREISAAAASVPAPVSATGAGRVQKLLTAARRARSEGNAKEARGYYDLLFREDPAHAEGSFYSSYYAVAETPVGEMAGVLEAFLRRLESIVQEMTSAAAVDHEAIHGYIREAALLLRAIGERQEKLRLELMDSSMKNAVLLLQQPDDPRLQQSGGSGDILDQLAALNRLRCLQGALLWAAYRRWNPGPECGVEKGKRLETLALIDAAAALAIRGNHDKDEITTAAMEIEASMRAIEPTCTGRAMEYLAGMMASAAKEGAAGQRSRRLHYLIRAQRAMGWQADYFTRRGWLKRCLEAIRLEEEALSAPGVPEKQILELNAQLAYRRQALSQLGVLRLRAKQDLRAEIAEMEAQLRQAQEQARKAEAERMRRLDELEREAVPLRQELETPG